MIQAFRALQSRNFRLYFFGQSVSLIGTWMQRTAVYWVIYEQTQSAFMLGATVFAAQFPAFLLSIIGGVVGVASGHGEGRGMADTRAHRFAGFNQRLRRTRAPGHDI